MLILNDFLLIIIGNGLEILECLVIDGKMQVGSVDEWGLEGFRYKHIFSPSFIYMISNISVSNSNIWKRNYLPLPCIPVVRFKDCISQDIICSVEKVVWKAGGRSRNLQSFQTMQKLSIYVCSQAIQSYHLILLRTINRQIYLDRQIDRHKYK